MPNDSAQFSRGQSENELAKAMDRRHPFRAGRGFHTFSIGLTSVLGELISFTDRGLSQSC